MGNIVAIVGRPNVGKSTLFNRLTQTRQAIVDEASGVTRDRQYGKVTWNGKEFSIIDTGGYASNTDDIFEGEIRKQVRLAIDEAALILFVVDTLTGITDFDDSVADLLRRSGKPVIVVANKVDTGERMAYIHEFYALGLGEPYAISSVNGSGTGDLLDEILRRLPKDVNSDIDDSLPKFTVVGRPNAGKSSIINAFLGEDRNIVTDIAGTTRDSIFTRYNQFGKDFYLVDTAGLRKKTVEKEDIEFYSTMRSVRAIENSDVCILMIDAVRGFESQDKKIFSLIENNNKGIVVLVNKWDLVEKDSNTSKAWVDFLHKSVAPYSDFPIVFTSVPKKQRIHQAIEEAYHVYENMKRRVPTAKLNEIMLPLIENYPPPATKGKYIKIKYITQLPSASPTFAFFCNLPQYIKEPYKRYLENKIRENWDFTGVPINLVMRRK
ncbi:MAG: ribosome biogenesis GTPase Der [Marinilabiliaceae bacterium]|nr:ribosome biogenesis GTPase Der [Marinilabiliaceae bacterium]